MFADDIKLVIEMVAKHGPVTPLFVEAGGLEDPTIADYALTIAAMRKARGNPFAIDSHEPDGEAVRAAQFSRYLQIHRPLEPSLPGYVCEDPGAGGASIEQLPEKYPHAIGCLVALSVLEHVEEPWYAPEAMHDAMKPGGLLIVSVPWQFPHHPSPKDLWRFSPDGLRKLFESPTEAFEVLDCDWRLDIPADAGVLDIRTGRPQAIQSCYLVARAR